MRMISTIKNATYLLMMVMLLQCSSDKVTPAISITSLSPSSASVGSLVAITGNGFSTVTTDNIVKFNGTAATVTIATANILTVEVPAGATTGKVTVQVGSNTATGPVFTVIEPTYYIKFKANGVAKVFGDSSPGFQACGESACSTIPAFDENRNADLQINKQESDWVVASDITGWNNQTIGFSNSSYPFASFFYTEDGASYGSDIIADQTGSSVHITNVVADGDISGAHSYKVTGTFSCKVGKYSDESVVTITEGQFVVKYTEDY